VEKPELELVVTLNALEHLGFKMYTTLPAVVAEYVANSWDAGATRVDITVPKGSITKNYAIRIEDNGIGMSVEELQMKFLKVGRNRRVAEGIDTVEVKGRARRVMGRKGLGKLAGFGVAGVVEVDTRQDGQFVSFDLNYDEIDRVLEGGDREARSRYPIDVKTWGETKDEDGTRVQLRALKRRNPVHLKPLRRNLARHFSVIGTDFKLYVNGRKVTPAERELQKLCEWTTKVDEHIDGKENLGVDGWIGMTRSPIAIENGRGIAVMARGKLVEEPGKVEFGGKGLTGQFGLSYLVGELNADFLDEEEDLVATGRRNVIWERYPASGLRKWLEDAIRGVCSDWVKRRTKVKMKAIKEIPVYMKRIATLPKREKKYIDEVLVKIAKREDSNERTLTEVAGMAASMVEHKTFFDLVQSMREADVSKPEVLFQFFDEWEVLDALELLRLVEGRREAIDKLQQLVDAGVREVPDMHNFLRDNPWLLNPTWDYMEDEVSVRKKLLEKFPEAKDVLKQDRRIDFLCLGYGRTLNVIELKRPGSTIGRKGLDQLEQYVDFVRELEGTDPKNRRTVVGYVIASKISSGYGVHQKAERLEAHSMYVQTYDDLKRVADNTYKRFVGVFESKAKRTGDTRLEEGVQRLKERTRPTGA
jgi:hypothetical protein